VPAFESIIGQKPPVRILKALLRNGNLPHALLLTGISGLGKETAAMALAMACNCTDPASDRPVGYPVQGCGQCRSCRKIIAGTHPDLIRIAPRNRMIRIEIIRDLLQTLAMKPYEARFRVVVLTGADTLNPAAGNALLKMLEEPPDRTLLILTAGQTSDLLPTIVSRCRHIRFSPVQRQDLENALVSDHAVPPPHAAVLATMAGGSLGRALELKAAGWVDRRCWLIDEIIALPRRSAAARMALAEALARDREKAETDLAIIELYLRDLAVAGHCPEKIVNMDLADQIRYASQQTYTASVLKKIDALRDARLAIGGNANLRLTMDVLILRLAHAINI
jgi:DNA polymerase III subunit delta'